jgi:hypothetical protein
MKERTTGRRKKDVWERRKIKEGMRGRKREVCKR